MIVKTPGSQMGSPVATEEGGEEVGEWREKWSVSEIDVDVDGTKSQIKVGRSCDPGWSVEDFAERWRVSLLTRMRDVNGAADETIGCWSRANRSGTHGVSGAMYRQMSAYGWSVCNGKANRIPIKLNVLRCLTQSIMYVPKQISKKCFTYPSTFSLCQWKVIKRICSAFSW